MINRARRRRTSSFIRGSRTLLWPHKCGEDGGILREPRAYEPVGFVRSVVVPVNSKSIYRGSHWQRERRADGWSFQCYIVISGTITIPSITIYGPNHSLLAGAKCTRNKQCSARSVKFVVSSHVVYSLADFIIIIRRFPGKKLPNSKLKSLQNTNCWTVSHSLPGSMYRVIHS